MKVDVGKKRSGKTEKAIRWVLEGRQNLKEINSSKRLLVVCSDTERNRILREYKDSYYELGSKEIDTYHDCLLHNHFGREIYIDNADMILQSIFHRFKISRISWNL
jgi:hypothetical protein